MPSSRADDPVFFFFIGGGGGGSMGVEDGRKHPHLHLLVFSIVIVNYLEKVLTYYYIILAHQF